jgi:rhodanese-related sulfurtransferase
MLGVRSARGYGHLPVEVFGRMSSPVRVIDVRDRGELAADPVRIPGALEIPMEELASAAQAWDPGDRIVVACRYGARSVHAAALLVSLGFRRVGSLIGGVEAYRGAGLPLAEAKAG